MELSGKIKKIMDLQTFDSGFRKKEMVITTAENYPQDIIIEFTQDRVNLLDPLQEGQDVKVSINIRGREWINPQGEAKYFNSINGWRVELIQAVNTQPSQDLPPVPPTVQSFPQDVQNTQEEDDLPF